ncbi:MAG: hypothetical protein ACYTGB_18950, partial [Planctomycetota bacterium]
GLTAEFDRIIGWSGGVVDEIRGICCGPEGTLYVIYGGQHYGHRRTTLISAFGPDGKYLRQIVPGPGGMPPEKRKGWPHAKLDEGREVPVVWHTLSRAINPGLVLADRCFPTVAPDGRLVMLSSAGCGSGVTHNDFHGGRRLLILGGDGSVPANYLGPEVCKDNPPGNGCAAISPDGKTAYVSALGGGKKGRTAVPLHNVVYKLALDGNGPGTVFAGKLNQAGSGASGFKNPVDLAVDKDGNVYVADHGNNRIAVFDSAGKHVKDLPAQAPWMVQVSRKTGAVYAVVENGSKVIKLGGLKDPAVKTALPVPGFKKYKFGYNTMIALDDSGAAPALWLVTMAWRSYRLHRLLDSGGSFKDEGDLVKKNAAPGINFTGGMAVVDGKLVTMTTELGMNWSARQVAYDVGTGKPAGPVFTGKMRANEVTTGQDGLLYTIGGGWKKPHPVNRFDAAFKEKPFAAGNPIKGFWHGHTRTGGMCADRFGNVYLLGADAYRDHKAASVRKYDPEGNLVEKQLVKLGTVYYGGLRVDSRSNVYVGIQAVDKGKPIPDWFAGKLPKDTAHHRPSCAYRQYGAVAKFRPSGGAVVGDPGGKHYGVLIYGKRGPVKLVNCEWLRRGGEVPVRGTHGNDVVHCFCETSRFDIDFHDRLFVPDIHRFCVQVLDSAGNVVSLIGSYGNMDNRGPKSEHPKPEIPYGWPLVAQVYGGKLYVVDLTNRRIVVAKLLNAVSEQCSVQ